MKNTKNTKEKRKLLTELQRYANRGIPIMLQDHRSTPEEVSNVCTKRQRQFSYMRDYIWTDSGVITELRFDKVKNQEL